MIELEVNKSESSDGHSNGNGHSQGKIYVFGYGSLLWKVEFSYVRRIFGYVRNYQRQFWLLSDDHRGTPEQ